MFNILHMMGKEYESIPIYAGSYYALIDELEAEAAGIPTPINYRLPVPMGSSGVLYSDTLHGMAPYVPQGPNVYDIRTTPDEDSKSIPEFFELVESLPDGTDLSIISVGTMTPLAKMFSEEYVDEMESKVLPKLKAVVQMGGAVDVPGNLFSKPTNLKAEFNIYNVCFCALPCVDVCYGSLGEKPATLCARVSTLWYSLNIGIGRILAHLGASA